MEFRVSIVCRRLYLDAKNVESIQPIFVLGRHRSGTTWVTNLLAAHPQVFTPQHEQHQGQHESAYFSNLLRYFSWGKTYSDRLALAAVFERSDYWHLLFPSSAPNLNIEELGVYKYFEEAMNQAAFSRKCTHWVENTPGHTLMIPYLLTQFPHARFFVVERGIRDTIQSNVYKFGNPNKSWSWIKASIWTEAYSKLISRYRKHVTLIKYERLLESFENERNRLFTAADLRLEGEFSPQWEPDSSYDGRPPRIPLRFRFFLRLVHSVSRAVPSLLAEWVIRAWLQHRRPSLPIWLFRVYGGAKGAN